MSLYKSSKRIVLTSLLAGFAISIVFASQEDFVVDEAVSSVVASPADAPVQSLNTFYFNKDTSLREALNTLAGTYHKNIIPSSRVDGKVNLTSLYDVTFEEALNAILGYDFVSEENGSFIKVYSREEYNKIKSDKSRMEYKVFTLYYITAEEACQLILPVVSSSGIVKGSSASKVGLSSGDAVEVDEGGNTLAQYDTIIIKDFPENIEQAALLLQQIDIKPKQVLVEATILSATLTEGMEMGVDINMLAGDSPLTLAKVAQGTTGTPIETTGFTKTGPGLKIGVKSGDISMFITALESITDTTVLANPKILALNKQLGTVFIGKKLGYRSSSSVSGSGVATEGEVKFLDTGTKLSFRPYIGSDNNIRMDIYPKDSSAELDDDGVPQETTAELSTNIMLKDGQTVVIGGLFRDSVTAGRKQVPVLGNIPVIGTLFQGISDSNGRQEVIVLLTCHIIDEPAKLDSDKRMEDVKRKMHAANKGLSFLGVPRLAQEGYEKAVCLYENNELDASLEELNNALILRPTYLEALRLKERILLEKGTDCQGNIQRIMTDKIEKEDCRRWFRN